LVEVGGVIYFAASTDGIGRELWRSDDTPGGTALVKGILPAAPARTPLSW
jgi:ELWxxDGT repeat protein